MVGGLLVVVAIVGCRELENFTPSCLVVDLAVVVVVVVVSYLSEWQEPGRFTFKGEINI